MKNKKKLLCPASTHLVSFPVAVVPVNISTYGSCNGCHRYRSSFSCVCND